MKFYQTQIISLLLLGSVVACGKKSEDESTTPSTQTIDPDAVAVTGTLALQTLRLEGGDVSHVVALNVETGETAVAEVDAEGNFELAIGKEQPWVLNYVDDSKTGNEMIVSSFQSETLDTLSAGEDAESIAMGTVDVSADTAAMDMAAADFLAAIKMSASAAATMGALDDVSRRYSNPDIDNNSKIDAVEGKSYRIDFHNRFTAQTAAGSALSITDLKNAFYPDDVVFSYTGTGIMPQIPKDDLGGTAPSTYRWTFTTDIPVATNGGNVCEGMTAGDVLTAGTAFQLTYDSNSGADADAFTFSLETANLKAGDYKLETGDKTYQWTNVAVSDFSAGKGFLALFIRIDVDANEKMTGISYQWKKKTDTGYTLASVEEIKLIVKLRDEETDFGGYISLKYQGDEPKGSIGVSVPVTQAEGSVVLADGLETGQVNVNGTVLTEQMVKDGVLFSDFTTNPGVSYDDKLGMRFFF
ncbi:hypothetical protein [Oligoflexus tunisiensis]|uniref:hypothetical protein n=1 Tax=Oligoflexus tunisiensis TaxID=708132 RepID=UPI00114CBCB9|nr:hypothetical protein [Oligoflexus tunisiensis]